MMQFDKFSGLFPSFYLAPIGYYKLLALASLVQIEQHEFFHKQTYRNRAVIYGANGLLPIIIPLKYKNHTPIKDVLIAYDYDWQKLHWRTLESAYRNSAYFEFYEAELIPFYEKKFTHLLEFNSGLEKKIIELIGLEINLNFTSSYVAEPNKSIDYREFFHPKKDFTQSVKGISKKFSLNPSLFNFNPYPQVFGNKFGFLPNLSIIDLLFNLGPQCITYLKENNAAIG